MAETLKNNTPSYEYSFPTPTAEELSSKSVEWQEEGFDLQQALDERTGPFVEVAGPTLFGYSMLDNVTLPKGVYVSNRDLPAVTNLYGSPDFQADATNLPLANNSLGALFVSNMAPMGSEHNPDLWEKFMKESARTLESGGLLIAQGLDKENIPYAEAAGLKPVLIHYEEPEGPTGQIDVDDEGVPIYWATAGGVKDFIFQKSSDSTTEQEDTHH